MYGYVVGPKPRQPGDIVADPAGQRWMVRIYPYMDGYFLKANLSPDTVPFDTIGKLYVSNLDDKVYALLPDDFDEGTEEQRDADHRQARDAAYHEAVKQMPFLYGQPADKGVPIPTELYFLEGDTVFRHVQPTVSPAEMSTLNAQREILGEPKDENVNLSILVELDGDAMYKSGLQMGAAPGVGFGPPAYFDERELIPIVARMTDVPDERQQELLNVLQTKYEQYDVAMGNWNEGGLKERPTPPPMGDKTANFLHAHPWIMKWIDRKDEPATVAWHFDGLPIGRFVTKASTAAWTNHDFTDGDGEGDYVSTKGVLGSPQAQTEWYKWVQTHEKQLLALMELPFDHNI